MTDTATLRQRLEARFESHFHGPGYDARGHGAAGDCAQCYEAAEEARAVFVAFLREQAGDEGWRAAPDPLALDVYTDVVRDELRRLADSIEAGDL